MMRHCCGGVGGRGAGCCICGRQKHLVEYGAWCKIIKKNTNRSGGNGLFTRATLIAADMTFVHRMKIKTHRFFTQHNAALIKV